MSGLPISRRQFLAASGFGLAGVAGSATYAFGSEPRHVELSPQDVPIPGLAPELEGLRILQISDLHLYDGIHPAARRTIQLAEEAGADVTLFTGDMCERTSQLSNLEAVMTACRGRLATLAVMGNWEYAAGISATRLAQSAERAGAELLFNQHRVLRVGGASLAFVGLDDPRAGKADPRQALARLAGDIPAIWTFHAPGLADRLSRERYPAPTFIAAGHTHGGQIRLPPIPAVTPPGSGRFVAGWYRDTFAPMYVSRGIGTTEIRARFLCPPEAPLFTLRRA